MALMTAQEIILAVVNDENLDPKEIEKRIEPAERKYLRPVLGKDLYADLLTNPSQANNVALLSYVKKALQHFVLWESLPFMRTKITTQGLMTNSTEFTEQSSKDDFGAVRKVVMSDAELELKELTDFLCENSANYPLWKKSSDDKIRNNRAGLLMYDTKVKH